ncbi:MAG: HEAT repeat domain-containing protein [Gammaproteobacteria bacterium]|nr:HEAT repeat domain-containing protein [Gammaproteobacteria bacterium]MBU1724049.1 HEAT repeat domain-containing protein [Gammaproteobacteria bacterium]MBU2006882.1 HEAT repeat domain-containing protein [Gammaproteobacteria bacterium]
MNTTANHWRVFPRWMMEEHETDILFSAQLSTGRATEVTSRIHKDPATLAVLLQLLGDTRTALSVRIGIGVVMEDLAGTDLLREQIPTLGKLTTHKSASIRADACHYLWLTGDSAALPHLQACLQDKDPEVREVATDALSSLTT